MNEAIYAAFDSVNIGPNLVLTQGNLLLQTSINSDNARLARSSVSVLTPANVEFLIYSPDNTKPSLASKAMMIGIASASTPLTNYVGADTTSYGYSPADGKLYNNGSSVATLGTATYGDYISLAVDPQNQTLTFYKNGIQLGDAYSLATAEAWYFAATVSAAAGNMGIYANTGATPMRYALPGSSGWYSPRLTIEPDFIASEPYITLPTDTLAHQKFSGDIDRMQSPVSISRGVNFWPWGASSPAGASGRSTSQLDLLDPNKAYDNLLTDDVRDLTVTFSRVEQGGSFDSAESTCTLLIDHVEQTSDQTKRIYMKDKLVLAQGQLVRPLFPPTVDQSVAGKPRPIAWGICRTYSPPCYDTTNLYYACSDAPLAQIGFPRVQGVPLQPGDYTETADAEGVQLSATPAGKFTMESSSYAGTFSIAANDYLAGLGEFGSASATGGIPDGWTEGHALWQSYFHTISGFSLTGTSPNKVLECANNGNMSWLAESTYTLKAGRSYAFKISIPTVPTYGQEFSSAVNAYIPIDPAELVFGGIAGFGIWQSYFSRLVLKAAGDYIGVFTNNTPNDVSFVMAFLSNHGTFLGSKIQISAVYLNELPPLSTNIALLGPGLDASLQEFLISHGPFNEDDYDSTGAQDIDTATGYQYGLYISESDTPTVEACARQLLDSATADTFVDRSGDIQTVRMFAPESYSGSVAGSLTVTDFATYLQQLPDNAENLTTRLSGSRNYSPLSESDFSGISSGNVSVQTRKQLEQPYQWTVVGGSTLSPRYNAANTASPLGTCLDLETDGQAEIDRITAIYSVPRNFYVGTVFTPIGRKFEVGDVWNVTYPTGSLTSGQKLLVVGLDERPSDELTTVTFWGL